MRAEIRYTLTLTLVFGFGGLAVTFWQAKSMTAAYGFALAAFVSACLGVPWAVLAHRREAKVTSVRCELLEEANKGHAISRSNNQPRVSKGPGWHDRVKTLIHDRLNDAWAGRFDQLARDCNYHNQDPPAREFYSRHADLLMEIAGKIGPEDLR